MKRKILSGLLPLVVLLLAVGSYAVVLFSRLGGAVEIILRENYRSVVAMQSIKEAAERLDSGIFFTLAGEEERGRKAYEENLPIFEKNLQTELGNITLPGERELAGRLKALHDRYLEKAAQFFAADPPARRQLYFTEMLPTFTELKNTAQSILDLNQDNMLRSDRAARELAADSTRYMIMAIALGTAAALFLAARLLRAILKPIRDVTAGAEELGRGNYDQVVPVPARDELGRLADTFNKLATQLRKYRQMTDDRLVQARQRTELTFSSLPDPTFVLSSDGVVQFQNPAAARLLTRMDARALPGPVQSEAEAVLKGGPDYLPESLEKAACVRVDDREAFVLPRVVGMRNEADEIFGAVVILQDVTRFRLLDDVKTNLVSTVSHELKTPLTSVRMSLHLLLEEKIGILNPQQAELLIAARDDAERLLQIINDLLDLARLESGAARFTFQTTPVDEIVESALRDAEAQAEQRGLRVNCELAPDLGAVMAEPQKLAHVLTNLISNAVKHSRAGGEIVLGARKQDAEGIRFFVRDHGPGILREYQHRIFERFFRVPGEEKTGAGLGLAIAREITTAHGGYIGVESEPGKGSEFYFVLPPAKPRDSRQPDHQTLPAAEDRKMSGARAGSR